MNELNDWIHYFLLTRIAHIDWLHILEHIPLKDKVKAAEIVGDHLELFDEDYQVIFDGDDLRFVKIIETPDLIEMRLKVVLNELSAAEYNKILRDTGLSLTKYEHIKLVH